MNLTAQRGAVPIKLDRERILFFDLAATWLLIQEYGIGFLGELYKVKTLTLGDVSRTELVLKSPDALVFFLWAGLQAEDPTLTREQVRGFLGPHNIAIVFNRLVMALSGTIQTPSPPAGNAVAAPPAKAAAKKTTPKPSKVPRGTLTMRKGLRLER